MPSRAGKSSPKFREFPRIRNSIQEGTGFISRGFVIICLFKTYSRNIRTHCFAISTTHPIHADMSKDFYREVDPATDKLIVDKDKDTLQQQPEKLTNFIQEQRLRVADGVDATKSGVNRIKSEVDEAEQRLNKKVTGIYGDDRSKLGLGVASVTVAMMTGTIVTRRSRLSMKLFTPVLFGLLSSMYVFPGTSRNVGNKIYQYELENWPILAKKQREIKMELEEGLQDCRDFSRKFRVFCSKWF